MIQRYNKLSLVTGAPGLLLQIAGGILNAGDHGADPSPVGSLCQVAGSILLIIGLYFYAKAKGRSGAWCLMGLVSIIGLLVLLFLKDESGSTPPPLPRRS